MSSDDDDLQKCVCGAGPFSDPGMKKHQNSCTAYLALTHQASEHARKVLIPAQARTGDSLKRQQGSIINVQPHPPLSLDQLPIQGLLRRQTTCLPEPFIDELPPAPPVEISSSDISSTIHPLSPGARSEEFQTDANSFGVYRKYHGSIPTYNPDTDFSIQQVLDNPNFKTVSPSDLNKNIPGPFQEVSPFTNPTEKELMTWYMTGSSTKSHCDLNVLVHNVILSPTFDREDLRDFDAAKASKALDPDNIDPTLGLKDGWSRSSVSVSLPLPQHKNNSEADAPTHDITGLLHRNLTSLIKSMYKEPSASDFHIAPFEEYWKSTPESQPERIYSELYNSNALLSEHKAIRAQHQPKTKMETVVLPIMLWSDATHLTNFGNASLWPAYLYNGYQSKYTRSKPTSFAAHYLAYIPKLDDSIYDAYQQHFNTRPSKEALAHLRRELMHAVWRLILDDKFMEAYENGIEILFPDGVYCLVFPRFFTYSADYPEKVLLTCVRYLGNFPCPRCLVHSDDIPRMGTVYDINRRTRDRRKDSYHLRELVESARRLIFQEGYSVNSRAVKQTLDDLSINPTRNAFSERLSQHNFDFHNMFVVDLLHEFELGVWKAVFTHLIRIVFVSSTSRESMAALNSRYRQVPTFGRAICRFVSNVSSMKKLAARDFEDLLQACLFEEPHDSIISELLFELATWHGLAKLRLHTTSTLVSLEVATSRLGSILRKFQNITCSAFATVELPSEEAARTRCKAQAANKRSEPVQEDHSRRKGKNKETASSHSCEFNLTTYKLHALGDYAQTIRQFGPTDGYSTQIGEVEHRHCKRFYPQVHKGSLYFAMGIAKHIMRERLLFNLAIGDGTQMHRPNKKKKPNLKPRKEAVRETLLPSRAAEHYQILDETRNPIRIRTFLVQHQEDPAIQEFLPCLRDHLLGRLMGLEYDGDDKPFSSAAVAIINNTIYEHKTLRVNYTTYDMRREQDTLNPRTHPNIMVLSPNSEEHPYWYAQIIGIFHAFIRHPQYQPTPKTMHFLWIRWYGMEPSQKYKYGWKARRLPRIGFVEDSQDPNFSPAFGFIDPANVIRAVHLIPAFHHSWTTELLGQSALARLLDTDDDSADWNFFYVNIFADRDMMMRFRGGGVGHATTRSATDRFLMDRDVNESKYVTSAQEASGSANRNTVATMNPTHEDTSEEGESESDENATSGTEGSGLASDGGDSDSALTLMIEEEEDWGYILDEEDDAELVARDVDNDDLSEDGIEELGYSDL